MNSNEINVRDFIQNNYNAYSGDDKYVTYTERKEKILKKEEDK